MSDGVFPFKSGDTLTMTIGNVDNQLLILVNNQLVYRRYVDNDPPLNDALDLAPLLVQGSNYITILLLNTGGPSHARFTLRLNNDPIKDIDFIGPTTKGLVTDPWIVTIPVS